MRSEIDNLQQLAQNEANRQAALADAPGSEPKTYNVAVLQEGGHDENTYTVKCASEDDAVQLAFALDGGWGQAKHGDSNDATDMLPLAQSYCRIVPNNG